MPKAPSNRHALSVVFLVLFIDLMGFSIIFPLYPAMLDHYLGPDGGGWLGETFANERSRFLVTVLFGGILGSLYSILQFAFSPIWGRLSDRIGRRPVLLLTQAATALSYLGWVFSGELWMLLATRVLAGIMSGNIAVATAAVSDVTGRDKRSRGMALVGVAFALGFLLGPAIGGLSAQWNWLAAHPEWAAWGINPFSVPAAFAMILSFANLVFIQWGFKETLSPEDREAARRERSATGSRLRALFHIPVPDIRRACNANFWYTLSFSGMEFMLAFYVVEHFAYSAKDIGMMFLFIGFMLILVQGGFVRRMGPKMGEKRLTLIGVVAMIIAFLLIAAIIRQSSFFVALGFMSIGSGLVFPCLVALVSLHAGSAEQGRYLGLFRSAGSLARAIGPLLAAVAYYFLGSSVTYAAGAAVLILPLMLLAKLRQPQRED
ncbi:MFS transporter [Ruficoccus amylovorans]|uniref:MFS transporter n=1 Tax=Ruficoccus amylovorans TaxID=1804625 RepID=A0A842HLS9_9BACT|nr:MFS transporter [Ruficoccus amylovorans]MBC2596417.1 MFS transporter [Ruficoccus amylovorans]